MNGLNRPALLLRGRRAIEVAAVLVILANFVTVAAATVRVQGNVTAVQIEADQAQVKDILAALITNFDVNYRSSIDLDAVRNGTYSGSLRQVLSRVLDGYNFVLEASGAKLKIIVLGKQGGHAIPAVVPSIAAAKNPATDWRPRR